MERANTLTTSRLVLCLPTISIFRLPRCSLWTPGLFRSEYPQALWNPPARAFYYSTPG